MAVVVFQQSKVYEYKMIGRTNMKASVYAAVYMDIGYRKNWDGYVKGSFA